MTETKSDIVTCKVEATDAQLAFLERLTGLEGQEAVDHYVTTGLLFFAPPTALQEALDYLELKDTI